MLGAIKLERHRLIDGHSHGFCRGVAIVSDMNRNGFSLQVSTSFSITNMLRCNFPELFTAPPFAAKQDHRDCGNEGIKSRSREASEFQQQVSPVPGLFSLSWQRDESKQLRSPHSRRSRRKTLG